MDDYAMNLLMYKAAFILAFAILYSCSTASNGKLAWDDEEFAPNSEEKVYEYTSLQSDAYTGRESLIGPIFPENHESDTQRKTFLAGIAGGSRSVLGRQLLNDREPATRLIAVKEQEANDSKVGQGWTTILVVTAYGIDWKFLKQAYARGGQKLATRELARRVYSGDTVGEYIAIEIPEDYMLKAASDGVDVRVDGSWGSLHVQLPSDYVRGFRKRLLSLGSDAIEESS